MSTSTRRVWWAGLVVACVGALTAPGQAAAASSHRPVGHPLRSVNPHAVAAGKKRARVGAALSSPMAALAAPGGPKAVVSGSLNQPGLSASDNSAVNDGSPPDPTGAVGPDHYFEFVNSVVRVYSKATLAPVGSAIPLDTFIGATGHTAFDPQIQWDPQGNRWFYLVDDCTNASCATTNNLAYGFSKTADPTGAWCPYFIRTDNKGGTGLFDDYPKLGHNDTQLIFGTNVFDALGNFVSSRIWTVPKPSAAPITGTCPSATPHYWSGPASAPVKDKVLLTNQLTAQDGSPIATPVPADTTDSSANGYVVAAHNPTGTKIMAWHVDASGNLVADGDITVSPFAIPANVPQPGTTDVIDSSDTRLTQAVAHADPDAGGAAAVWTQHTINGPGGRSVDRWYELLPATGTKRQEGNISDPASFVFNGAISPTMSGNEAVIQYNVGGSSQLAQIWASSRKAAQPLSAMSSPVKLGDSTHFDQDFTCPSVPPQPGNPPNISCRWGDYAAATPDPAAATGQADGPEHRVWGTNQLIANPRSGDPTAPHWITRNFGLVPERLAPSASFTATPPSASRGSAVSFDGSASRDAELPGGIATYAWDFDGDGTTDQTTTTPTVTHAYTAVGTFSPRLVVTDADDGLASAPATQSVAVQNVAPTARLTVSPMPVVQGKPTTLTGSGSTDPDGSITAYKWDLDGNGTFETNTRATPKVTRKFKTARTFAAGLQVTDSDGATSVAIATVRVVRPKLKLTLTLPKSVRLNALLAGGLRGKAKCARSCVVKIKATLPRKVAKRLGISSTVALGTVKVSGTGAEAVKLVVGRKARTALNRANPKTLTLNVSGTATAGASRSRATRVVGVRR